MQLQKLKLHPLQKPNSDFSFVACERRITLNLALSKVGCREVFLLTKERASALNDVQNLVFAVISYNGRVLSPRLRSIVSICLILHIGLFVATLSTASVDSTVRDRLLDIAMPYTAAAHIHLGDRAIADVTHSTADWRHRLEYRLGESKGWTTTDLNLGNPIGGSRRFERYLTTIAETSQREDTATAAMLAEPLVVRLIELLEGQSNEQASARLSSMAHATFQIRVVAMVREPVEAVAALGSSTGGSAIGVSSTGTRDRAAQHRVRWRAGVVPKSGFNESNSRGWSVVFLEEPRLNAKAATESVALETPGKVVAGQ